MYFFRFRFSRPGYPFVTRSYSFHASDITEALDLCLDVNPNLSGWNLFEVVIKHPDGRLTRSKVSELVFGGFF